MTGDARSPTAELAPPIPAPSGADLITNFMPLDRLSLERSVARFVEQFDRLREPGQDVPIVRPDLLPVAAAVVVLEVARRWRQRKLAPRVIRISKSRSSWLHGML